MRPPVHHLLTAVALLAPAMLAPHASAAPAPVAPVHLTLLTPGTPPLAHVKVTAMTFLPDGTVYAGGRYLAPPVSKLVQPPYTIAGSVLLVSHDRGVHWESRVSTTNPGALPQVGVAPWHDHTRWPLDFLALAITVDPGNPHIIYAAGCTTKTEDCSNVDQGHGLLRSTDGGRTWNDALIWRESNPSTYPTAANVTTNIVKTPGLFAALRYIGQRPARVFSVAVDSRHHGRVYACASGTGVLRSDDNTRTWHYVPQPNRALSGCELALDPIHPGAIFSTDSFGGILYRSTDEGQHWNERARLGQSGPNPNAYQMTSLMFVGRELCVTVPTGIYGTSDGGAHWRRIEPQVYPQDPLGRSVRGSSGWLAPWAGTVKSPGGLFTARDGAGWQFAVATDAYGPPNYGALDFNYALDRVQARVWEDRVSRTAFTAGTIGGLYRWGGAP